MTMKHLRQCFALEKAIERSPEMKALRLELRREVSKAEALNTELQLFYNAPQDRGERRYVAPSRLYVDLRGFTQSPREKRGKSRRFF